MESAEDGGEVKFLSVKVGRGDRTRGRDGNMYETRRAPGTAPAGGLISGGDSAGSTGGHWSPSASLEEQSLMRYVDSKESLRSGPGRPHGLRVAEPTVHRPRWP